MAKPNLLPVGTINELRLHEYEHYLPTAFDESMSILQKINKIIRELANLGKLTNEMLERWNEVYKWVMGEGLENAVEDKLQEWYDNGTLADIINGQLFSDLNKKVDTKQDFDKMPVVDVVEYQRRNPSLTFTQALQAVLDMAKPSNKGMVKAVVPKGKYQLTAELNIYSNTVLECYEGVIFERYHSGYFLLNGVRGENYYGYNGHGNIQIIGGTWDGRGTIVSGTGSHFALAHGKRIIIKDCVLKDANSHHIEINSSQDVLIDNCQLLGLINTSPTAESIQLDISSSSAGFPAFGAYDATPCYDIEVRDCYFGPSGTVGTNPVARAFGSHACRIGAWHKDVRFLNNTIEGGADYACQLLSYQDVTISGNTFINCAGGVIMYAPQTSNANHMLTVNGDVATASQTCSGFKITDNSFRGVYTKAAVYAYGDATAPLRDIKVSNNTIYDTPEGVNACFVMRYSEHVTISDNYFYSIDTFPISFNVENHNFTIRGNQFLESTSSCIRVQDIASQFIISENICKKNGRHAFEIFGSGVSEFIVSNNLIEGANGRDIDNHGMYMHSGVSKYLITENIFKTLPSYVYVNAMYITNTSKDGIMSSNIVQAGSGTPIVAVSTIDKGNLIMGTGVLTNAPAEPEPTA